MLPDISLAKQLHLKDGVKVALPCSRVKHTLTNALERYLEAP
jgi:hypothetical protein